MTKDEVAITKNVIAQLDKKIEQDQLKSRRTVLSMPDKGLVASRETLQDLIADDEARIDKGDKPTDK